VLELCKMTTLRDPGVVDGKRVYPFVPITRFFSQFQGAGAGANLLGFAGTLWVRTGTSKPGVFNTRHVHTISGPPRSATGFAPTCSTRRCQLEPR
jgi:hypothetical protein